MSYSKHCFASYISMSCLEILFFDLPLHQVHVNMSCQFFAYSYRFFFIERHYSPGSHGSRPRVSRCFSPPPPDIERVVKCVVADEYYIKKKDDQVK